MTGGTAPELAVGNALAPVQKIPHGRRIELHQRGTTFVRTIKGPPGAPTVLLLHGLAATAWPVPA